MNDHDTSRAAEDVIATTDSYGGPVSEEELAQVYLAPDHSGDSGDTKDTADRAAADVGSDPAKGDDEGSDWTDEGGATPEGPATDTPVDS